MSRESFPNTVANRRRTLRPGVGQDDGKFVAPEARHHVRLTGAPPNDGGGFHQGPASGLVTVIVINALESVQIKKQQR